MNKDHDDLPEFVEDDEIDNEQTSEYSDESGDKKYFVQIPEMVMALTDPYEYRLWAVVKMITGKHGKCIAGAKLLAQLTGMSVGKVSQCRQSLCEKELLKAKRENLGQHTSRIRIVIPDLWEKNVTWRKAAGDSLYCRAKIYEQKRSEYAELHKKQHARRKIKL